MKKTIISCALAMFAIVGLVTACSQQEASPVSYAPADADLIAYINGKKLSANKVGQAIKAREDAKTEIAEAEKKCGFKVDDVLNSEIAVFINTKTIEGDKTPAMSIIGRFEESVDLPGKLFECAKKNGKNTKELTIDGKKAITDEKGEFALIELSKSTLQFSAKQGDKPFGALKPGAGTELTKSIDTGALISIAYKVSDEARKQLKETLPMIPEDVAFVTLNVRERQENIDAEIVVTFEKEESAKVLESFLITIRETYKSQIEDPAAKKQLEGVKVVCNGNKIVVSASATADEIVALINDQAKPAAPAKTAAPAAK